MANEYVVGERWEGKGNRVVQIGMKSWAAFLVQSSCNSCRAGYLCTSLVAT